MIGSTEMAHYDSSMFYPHLKLVLTGNHGVGKTSIIRRFIHNSYTSDGYRDDEFERSTQNLITYNIIVV